MAINSLKWRFNSFNQVLKGKDKDINFYISFNPYDTTNPLNGTIFESDSNGPETALVFTDESEKQRFLIINGDLRKEYEKHIKSFRECLNVYRKHLDDQSTWSSDLNIVEFAERMIKRLEAGCQLYEEDEY